MKVEIESIVCNWADEIPHIFIRVINAITLYDNKEELRSAISKIAEETELDKFFVMNYKNKKGHGKVSFPCFYIFVHSISLYVVLSFVDILFVF